MTVEQAIQVIREDVTRQIGQSNISDLRVEHLGTAFGSHQIKVSYRAFGKDHDYTVFSSVSGFSSSISGLDGRSLGTPGERR